MTVRVLLAEDNAFNLEVLSHMLQGVCELVTGNVGNGRVRREVTTQLLTQPFFCYSLFLGSQLRGPLLGQVHLPRDRRRTRSSRLPAHAGLAQAHRRT